MEHIVMDEQNRGPLKGLRILDLADEKGIYCTKLLAGLGADVVKVEPPGGDPLRDIGPFFQNEPDRGKSLNWFHYNINKRSITLNLKTMDGQKLFKKLSAKADIIVETFPPGVVDDLGIGWKTISEINSRLIWASITPFGQRGPWRDFKSSDLVAMAAGGLLSTCGWPHKVPETLGGEQAYHMASSQAAVGVLMALYERTKTRKGKYIDISLHASIPVNLMISVPVYEKTGRITVRGWGWHADPVTGIFPCRDGYIDFRFRIQRWDDFVKWLDDDGMADELKGETWKDPWYRQRPENIRKIDEIFCKFLMRHTKLELYEEGQKRGFEIGPVNTIPEVGNNAQLRKRNYFVPVEHPELGETLEYLGPPFRSSLTPWQIMKRAPLAGEHNEEIYQNELGLDRQELISLTEAGII